MQVDFRKLELDRSCIFNEIDGSLILSDEMIDKNAMRISTEHNLNVLEVEDFLAFDALVIPGKDLDFVLDKIIKIHERQKNPRARVAMFEQVDSEGNYDHQKFLAVLKTRTTKEEYEQIKRSFK